MKWVVYVKWPKLGDMYFLSTDSQVLETSTCVSGDEHLADVLCKIYRILRDFYIFERCAPTFVSAREESDSGYIVVFDRVSQFEYKFSWIQRIYGNIIMRAQ